MVKLVRLATDNNGIFKSNFQNDVLIEPQSQIALLNATFNVDYDVLDINQTNNLVTVQTDTSDANTLQSDKLEINVYGSSEAATNSLLNNIKDTLNRSLQGLEWTNFNNNAGSQFNIREINGQKRVELRYSPFLNPLYLPTQEDGTDGEPIFDLNNNITDVTTNDATFRTTISKKAGIAKTDNRSNNVITGLAKFCSGNGLLTIRISSSVTNSSGLQDNGFGIGLTTKNLPDLMDAGEEIEPANRGFEIRYNRPAETYKFLLDGDAVESDSGVTPINILGGNLYEHDFVYFEMVGGILYGGVCQSVTGTPTKTQFFEQAVNDGEELYPYIYLRGRSTEIITDMFNMTLDPWLNQEFDIDANKDSPYWRITGTNESGNPHSAFTNKFEEVYDNLWNTATGDNVLNIPDDNARWQGPSKTFTVKMHRSVWEFLGFSNLPNVSGTGYVTYTGTISLTHQQNCWSYFLADKDFGNTLTDNFMIESNSLTLDSFDASKVNYSTNITDNTFVSAEADKQGRRKNILMTIPVNDNATGLVEFETNTPIFIDINNASRLNQKSLNFKILDLNFKEIKTNDNTSVITLLIKGPNE